MKVFSVIFCCLATAALNGCDERTSERSSMEPSTTVSVAQPTMAPGEALDRPDFDRSKHKTSAQSIARGDLLACRNLDAGFSNLKAANAREMAEALHGTWVNPNMRSVHGRPIDTDAIFLIDMKSERPASILIDRNNLGRHVLNRVYERATTLSDEQRLMMSFVNCSIEFVDYYIKISDDVLIDELARGTRVNMDRIDNLDDAWQALVKGKYFDSFEMRTAPFSDATRRVSASQGDHQRVAITPERRVFDERQIERGLYPGGEYYLPMVTGGLFHISLKDVPPSGGLNAGGVELYMDAEYRGVGIGLEPGVPVEGFERGVFRREGNAFVAGGGPADELWATSACADKHNLDALSQVSNPAGHEGHQHDMLVFDRLVIGSPM